MANSLTGLIPILYDAVDVVSREMVGFCGAVTHNTGAERAAVGEQIIVPITQPQAAQPITPAVVPPDTGDQAVGNVSMYIQKAYMVPVRWNGEQQKGVRNAGIYEEVVKNQFAQAMRTLVNMVEADCWTAAYQNASRAYGTAGSVPFSNNGDLSDFAQTRKLLDDNGCPQTDMQLVLGSTAVASLRGKQGLLLKVNESGDNRLLRNGSITDLPVEGFWLHNSNAVQRVAAGTGANYVTSGANAVGTTQAALTSGTGSILAGDIINLTGDTNNYVVNTGISAPGTATIGAPGFLMQEASGTVVTVGAAYTPNVAFSKSAIQLITRPPATPTDMNGRSMDSAEDSVLITDQYSGLTFEVAVYRQYKQVQYQVGLAWGANAVKPNHIVILRS